MNLITHRLTLDVLKNGVQKILHGFFAGEVLSRRIAITLTAGSTSVELAQDAVAVMYITKSNGTKSINACSVVGNTVLYDILQTDTDTTGITMMQIKVVSNDKVVYAPIFAIEVQSSIGDDTEATTSPTYTALEEALVKAEEAYNARLVSVDIEEDLTFKATYADGTEHTSDAIKNAFAEMNLALDAVADLETLNTEISAAEQERVTAEAQRVVEHEAALNAEAARAEAEQQRATTFTQMASDVQSALDETTALQKKVEELAAEGGADLTGYATEEYVDEAVKNASGNVDLTGYATETYVDNAVSSLASTDYVDEAIQNASTGDVDLTGYATEEYVNNAVSGLASTEEVAATFSDYASKKYVDDSVSGLATKEEVTNAVSGVVTEDRALDLFLRVDGFTQRIDVVTDVNNFYTGIGVFSGAVANLPTEEWWLVISGGAVGTTTQVAFSLFNNMPVQTRNCAAGTWGAWGPHNTGSIIIDTDPGVGATVDYPDGTLLFVKETA